MQYCGHMKRHDILLNITMEWTSWKRTNKNAKIQPSQMIMSRDSQTAFCQSIQANQKIESIWDFNKPTCIVEITLDWLKACKGYSV